MMPKCFAFLFICMPRRRIGVDSLLIALWDEAVATVSPFPSEAQRSRRDTCAKAQFLEAHCPKCLAQAIVECGGDPLFSEGTTLRPRMPEAPALHDRWIGEVPADGAVASGEAYTDAALRGTTPKSRRAGLAYVWHRAG